jgi:hypothetical protein
LLKLCVKYETPFSKVCQNHAYFPQEKGCGAFPKNGVLTLAIAEFKVSHSGCRMGENFGFEEGKKHTILRGNWAEFRQTFW